MVPGGWTLSTADIPLRWNFDRARALESRHPMVDMARARTLWLQTHQLRPTRWSRFLSRPVDAERSERPVWGSSRTSGRFFKNAASILRECRQHSLTWVGGFFENAASILRECRQHSLTWVGGLFENAVSILRECRRHSLTWVGGLFENAITLSGKGRRILHESQETARNVREVIACIVRALASCWPLITDHPKRKCRDNSRRGTCWRWVKSHSDAAGDMMPRFSAYFRSGGSVPASSGGEPASTTTVDSGTSNEHAMFRTGFRTLPAPAGTTASTARR
jgi:hypothetical protein